MKTWVTVMTGVSPSFRVGVSFGAILLCLLISYKFLVVNYAS